ncbi:MAG: four-carbon acid sugar kinase family protein [Bryobacteraceae bacterium]
MIEVLAIADDMTGAAEAGAKFAQAGIPAILGWECAGGATDGRVVVIDSETRHATAAAAYEQVFACARLFTSRITYKKTDSTLRGNIGAELRALSDARPSARIAYVPAYPALGRTVRDGLLLVDGVPLHETTFAADPLNPVTDSRVRRVLDGGLPCDVFDASTDAEIDAIAADILSSGRYSIVAGPAAIAGALAVHLQGSSAAREPWPKIDTCLVVNGSMHPASARQVSFAENQRAIGESLPWRIHKIDAASVDPLALARVNGATVRDLLAGERYHAVMVFGGDTAFGILEAFGLPLVRPLGELLPGVAISRVDRQDWFLITKAGGFGGEDLIRRIRTELNGVIY